MSPNSGHGEIHNQPPASKNPPNSGSHLRFIKVLHRRTRLRFFPFVLFSWGIQGENLDGCRYLVASVFLFWGGCSQHFFLSGGRSGILKKHSTNERSVEALPRISRPCRSEKPMISPCFFLAETTKRGFFALGKKSKTFKFSYGKTGIFPAVKNMCINKWSEPSSRFVVYSSGS